MGPLQLMQRLTGTPHQGLTAGLAQLPVSIELFSELAQQLQLMRGQGLGHLAQAAAQKGLKGLTPALQIAEPMIRLQLQPLLQRPQPSLKDQEGSAAGFRLWAWS
jgi:hypothetical protein